MAAPGQPDRNCCSREAWADKPLDCCMWAVLILGIITGIVGIACLGVGATGFGATIAGSLMIIIGGFMAIPSVFMKCKACMITFVPIAIVFCVVGGIIVGFWGFVGGVAGALCDFVATAAYICEGQTKASAPYCKGYTSYNVYLSSTTKTECDKSKYNAADKKCCKAMFDKVPKPTTCITDWQDKDCKAAKATHAAGFVGIIAAIFGCVTTCVACCTCFGANSYFGYSHLQQAGAPGVPVQGAAPVVIAAPMVVATPEATKA